MVCISNSSNLMKPKGVIVWKSCFPGGAVLSTGDISGGCVKSVGLCGGFTPTVCTEAVNVKCRASQGSGGILISTATKGNAVQTIHNLFAPKPGSDCPLCAPVPFLGCLSLILEMCHRKAGSEFCSKTWVPQPFQGTFFP